MLWQWGHSYLSSPRQPRPEGIRSRPIRRRRGSYKGKCKSVRTFVRQLVHERAFLGFHSLLSSPSLSLSLSLSPSASTFLIVYSCITATSINSLTFYTTATTYPDYNLISSLAILPTSRQRTYHIFNQK